VLNYQLSATKYKPMLQYACQEAGYDNDIIPISSFKNVISGAFDIGLFAEVALVRCAFSSVPLCLGHFTEIPHLHFED